MLDSIYHMTLKEFENRVFWREIVKVLTYFAQHLNGCHNVTLLLCKPLVVFASFPVSDRLIILFACL